MKKTFFIWILSCFAQATMAQGCSDAGVCTIGDFYAQRIAAAKKAIPKNEIDILFTYGMHGQYERFYTPQLNYRRIRKNGSFVEIRVPLSIASNSAWHATTSGIGDIIATYNNKFYLNKEYPVKYSLGLRISLSHADKKDSQYEFSYPMSLQTGLGTTDLLAAASYDIGKWISVGAGMQIPILHYNRNVTSFDFVSIPLVTANDYHRQPDALLKLTGHYQWKKFKVNGGTLAIFHLADDYYKFGSSRDVIRHSHGLTLNWNIEPSYAISKKCMVSILYAEPFKTRISIPDGLGRTRILSPKVTFGF